MTNTSVCKANGTSKTRIGEKVDVLCDGVVLHPSGQALDATLGLGAIGHVRRDFGQLGALAGHDAADEGGQGAQVWASRPVGSPGYPCVKASRMARYGRRLSLIVYSFWIGRAFQERIR